MDNQQLSEGLEAGDLARLVDNRVTIDEYRSKIGDDDDIIVVAFKIQGRDPAIDLVNFIEKGYEWVLDADASSGELSDGGYLVFVELDREPSAAENLYTMFGDLERLTDIESNEWTVVYHKPHRASKLEPGVLENLIPLTREDYQRVHKSLRDSIDQLKTSAGVQVETQAPKNAFTESLRIAAGIR